MTESRIQRKLVWENILFFGITSFLAVVGLPIYLIYFDLAPGDWFIFGFMAIATMMGTTFGLHRLFSHKAFKAHPVIVFLNLFFSAAAFEGSVMRWASRHRDHHRFPNTDRDAYNINKGFWHAHMDWFLTHEYAMDWSNVKDLESNKLIKFQHDTWVAWAIISGIVFPLALALLIGTFWGTFFLGVCGRLFFIHQSVFLINSACHKFGKPTYDLEDTAKDSWVCALLTNGEGYHSYHHKFPNDYRNGIKWFHWDPTKWLVKFYSFFGLTWDLKKTPEHQILAAKSSVEQELLLSSIGKSEKPVMVKAKENADILYAALKEKLVAWEKMTLEYKKLYREFAQHSAGTLKAKAEQVKLAKEEFLEKRKEWVALIERYQSLIQPQVV